MHGRRIGGGCGRHLLIAASGYRGILQCDGYPTYKKLTAARSGGPGVTLVYCWSHVRRGFYDQAKAGTSPIAVETLARIAALYRIEADIRGKDAAHRLAVRQAKSQPLVADLRTWFQAKVATLPARGPTAQAIGYALKHWDGLERFLYDGRIGSPALCVDRDGVGLIFGKGASRAHTTRHEQALSHAGLSR